MRALGRGRLLRSGRLPRQVSGEEGYCEHLFADIVRASPEEVALEAQRRADLTQLEDEKRKQVVALPAYTGGCARSTQHHVPAFMPWSAPTLLDIMPILLDIMPPLFKMYQTVV